MLFSFRFSSRAECINRRKVRRKVQINAVKIDIFMSKIFLNLMNLIRQKEKILYYSIYFE